MTRAGRVVFAVALLGALLLAGATFSTAPPLPRTSAALAGVPSSGSLDKSFGGDGKVLVHLGGKRDSSSGYGLAIQPDRKLIVAGMTDAGSHDTRFVVIRLDVDGRLDPSFSRDGSRTIGFGEPHLPLDEIKGAGLIFNSVAQDVAVQADGKIVVAGTALRQRTRGDFALARLMPDGRLDKSFGTSGRVTIDFADIPSSSPIPRSYDHAESVAILADGRILVAGYGHAGYAIARLTSDGVLDPTFGNGGRRLFFLGDTSIGMAVGSDGVPVLAGWLTTVVRLTPDGSLDPNFLHNGERRAKPAFHADGPKRHDDFWGLAVQGDGKILVTGGAAPHGGKGSAFGVLRLNPNGSQDGSFANGGSRIVRIRGSSGLAGANAVAIAPSGRIVLAGDVSDRSYDVNFGLVRLMPGGRLDHQFGNDGQRVTGFGGYWNSAQAVGFDPAGDIVAAGYGGECDDSRVARRDRDPSGSRGCNIAVARYRP